MKALLNPELVSDLQFALNVMEEKAHLGLDDKSASDLKAILLRHIKEAKLERESRPADQDWNESWDSQVSACTTRLARLRSAEARSEKRTRLK
jgi:hypothetical protein